MGLIEGLVIGLALGVAAGRGLGLSVTQGITACLLGAATGFVVGLVAGQPVWARDGKTEALLKAGAGALGGAGLAFAAAHWLKVALDLSAFRLGAGPAGQLPAAVLPLIASALALLFELDHDGAARPATRIALTSSKQRTASAKVRTAQRAELAELERDDSVDPEQRRGRR
jgi:hypothetical protein